MLQMPLQKRLTNCRLDTMPTVRMSKAQGNKNTGEGGGGAQELIFFY